jgi:UDP-N-acetylmuramoylalanine--D-glutamate ligase
LKKDKGVDLKNKNVMVVGLAETGLAVTRFLRNRGANVTISDLMTLEQLGDAAETALSLGAHLKIGGHNTQDFLSQSLIILSPGVPHTIEAVQASIDAGIPVMGEIELAARNISEPIVAITGTNGKTTTTELTGRMLKESGLDVFVGGNIGNPLIGYVDAAETKDVVVAEVSSFQLDTTDSFKPKVGVLLNVTEDHLDRYEDYDDYVRSKGKLFRNQEGEDYAVLNAADPSTGRLTSQLRAQLLYFNTTEGSQNGAYFNNSHLFCRLPEREMKTIDLSSFQLQGRHNLENAAAAALAALVVGASESGVTEALRTFPRLRHRLEHVTTVKDVHYYNDSKGTNVGAVERALESFDVPVVLIMGGRDKGGDYGTLGRLLKTRVRELIVIGEAKEVIEKTLRTYVSIQKAETLPDAVRKASTAAVPGDVVLLSPGCSSFDMFKDYAHRGEIFCEAVRNLE